jgi:hypothetical protein
VIRLADNDIKREYTIEANNNARNAATSFARAMGGGI